MWSRSGDTNPTRRRQKQLFSLKLHSLCSSLTAEQQLSMAAQARLPQSSRAAVADTPEAISLSSTRQSLAPSTRPPAATLASDSQAGAGQTQPHPGGALTAAPAALCPPQSYRRTGSPHAQTETRGTPQLLRRRG